MKKYAIVPMLVLALLSTDAMAMGKRRRDRKKKLDGHAQSGFCDIGSRYKIDSGDHRSTRKVSIMIGTRTFSFRACFDESARYDLGNSNQADINKLYGFSDCGSSHHVDSARVGWRWREDLGKVEVVAYTYADKQWSYESLGTLSPYQVGTFQIATDDREYIFNFNGRTLRMRRGCDNRNSFRYRLYPYFGGNESAPHDIRIWVDEFRGTLGSGSSPGSSGSGYSSEPSRHTEALRPLEDRDRFQGYIE